MSAVVDRSGKAAVLRLQRSIAILSVVLFLLKISAYFLTRSVAVLSDALESTVNIAAGFVGLYAVRVSSIPRDANHPYGHGKAEYVSAAIEGSLIMGAALFILVAGIQALRRGSVPTQLDVGLLIMLIAGASNLVLGKLAIRNGNRYQSMALRAAGRHLLTDVWTTAAVLCGIGLVWITHQPWLDPLVGMLMALYIGWSGWGVLRKALAGIMDEADTALVKRVVNVLQENRQPQWIDLHNLRVSQYSQTLHLDAHLTLPWYASVRDADAAIHDLERLTATHFGDQVELFLHIDACQYYQCKLCAVAHCPVRREELKELLIWTPENVARDSKHGKMESV